MAWGIFDCDMLMAVFSCHLLSNCSRIICMFSTSKVLFLGLVHTVPLNKVQAAVFLSLSSALLLDFSFPWWDNPTFCFFYIVFLSVNASLISTNWILTKGRQNKLHFTIATKIAKLRCSWFFHVIIWEGQSLC